MAKTYKYTKRTGSKGNYKYFYRDSDGRLSLVPEQEKAKQDHAARLVAGLMDGAHSMSHAEMAAEVGVDRQRINSRIQNLKAKLKIGVGHGYEKHHIEEAKLEPGTKEYESRVAGIKEELARRKTGEPAPKSKPKKAKGTTGKRSDFTEAQKEKIRKLREELGLDLEGSGTEHLGEEEKPKVPTPVVDVPKPKKPELKDADVRAEFDKKFKNPLSNKLDWTWEPEGKTSLFGMVELDRFRRHDHGGGEDGDDWLDDHEIGIDFQEGVKKHGSKLERFNAALKDAGYEPNAEFELGEKGHFSINFRIKPKKETLSPVEVKKRVKELRKKSKETAAALEEAEPEFEATEEPVQRMVEDEAKGENPYLNRAKEVFDRVSEALEEDRKTHAKYMLQAIDKAGFGDLAAISSAYQEISGKRNFKGAVADFEKATFTTIDEIVKNEPVDIEVERMKRGYPALQFARMKPFLKDSWHSNNKGAPPPMPTFGDLKSWGEHGEKPEWAGRGRIAVPKAVYDASVKIDGKPQYPPAWMPINLMPVWNYVVKKAGPSAYAVSEEKTQQAIGQDGRVTLGVRAEYKEGMIIAALRKYVQMRGGPNQLVDIPKSKLAEAGLTHKDIFKADSLGDAQIKELIKNKVIDIVALLPLIDEELKKQTRKSFSLVVDFHELPFKKTLSEENLRKSLIRKIQRLKNGPQKHSYMSRV